MEEKLFKVEDTFLIEGRGLVIAGLLEDNAPNFRVGDKIKFYCSDNLIISSEIAGLEMIRFISSQANNRFKKVAFSVRNLNDKKSALKDATVYLIK